MIDLQVLENKRRPKKQQTKMEKKNCTEWYSLRAGKRSRLGQRHGLQNITLTPCYYKNIYRKVRYVYFYESIFQDKSIHIIFTFAKSTILKLLMIYIPNV